jgi:26S proteasome regulatory subunit N2
VPEPSFHNISNPARVVRLQMRKLSMTDGARYAPIKPISQGGIILFENLKTDEEEEIVELAVAGGVTGEKEAKENKVIEPHSPFEFAIGDY